MKLTITTLISLALASTATADSLPEVSAGPLPGPSILYAPLAIAPQFENAPPWQAAPLRVSGTEGYAAGEYLFQDWIYDSYGANTTDAPAALPDTAPSSATGLASAPTGDVVYPSDAAVYGFDAADLLELRAKLVPGGIAYRITLNTMLVPDAAIAVIGIDTDQNAATGTSNLGPGNCDVTGNGLCNGQDANAVKRAALGQPSPTFGQNCHNALGTPVPPEL